MNIDITLSAQVSKVGARVVVAKDSGLIRRIVKLTLAREFDVEIAAALGKDAKKTLALLEVGSITKASIPIDGIVATGDLKSIHGACHIGELRGVKAECTADTGEDGLPPAIALEFEFDMAPEPWMFVGNNLSVQAVVTIRSLQLDNGIDKHQPTNRRGRKVEAEA